MKHVESETTRILTKGRTGDMKSSTFRFQAGDVLYGRLRPYLNKVCIPSFDGFASTEFYVLRPHDEILGHYLLYFLNQSEIAAQATRINQGDRPRVKWSQLAEFEIPLPPIDEQRRIVEAIETHLSHLDAGVESLDRAKRNVERMRSATLKAAANGTLPVAGLDPAAWAWSTVGEVGRVQLGRQRAPKYHNGPNMRPYLRVANVFEARIDTSDVMQMDFPLDHYETYRLD
jgi:type I restriction enzyme S subunit